MTTSYTILKKKMLKKTEVKKAYDALASEYDFVSAIIDRRLKRGWTQQYLAEQVGTKQPVISRLERGESNPSLYFLRRVAQALGTELKISFK